MAEDLVQELQPKDILRFVERKAERALEVLREIIDLPEYDNAQIYQALQASANTAWSNSTNTQIVGNSLLGAGLMNGLAQSQQGGFNG